MRPAISPWPELLTGRAREREGGDVITDRGILCLVWMLHQPGKLYRYLMGVSYYSFLKNITSSEKVKEDIGKSDAIL